MDVGGYDTVRLWRSNLRHKVQMGRDEHADSGRWAVPMYTVRMPWRALWH